MQELYIFLFLHQTTTASRATRHTKKLYIFLFLHQTTTLEQLHLGSIQLYIFLFLHQTTTFRKLGIYGMSCISFFSYIKPQLQINEVTQTTVVYLSFPTSNHNCNDVEHTFIMLYIFLFLHQTTTNKLSFLEYLALYIFLFLHQTTTVSSSNKSLARCISFFSYIKPQLCRAVFERLRVVYLSFPTSNHNHIPPHN